MVYNENGFQLWFGDVIFSAFTKFAACEYVIVSLNIFFHYTATWDLSHIFLAVDDSNQCIDANANEGHPHNS